MKGWLSNQTAVLAAQVDFAVVEAGLGGARDATNVFRDDRVRLSVITAIGLDHQHVLGIPLRLTMIISCLLPRCHVQPLHERLDTK